MVKNTNSTGGTRRSSRVSGQRTADQRTTRATAGGVPPTTSIQQPKRKQHNKKATADSGRPPRVPRGAKGGRPTSEDEEKAAEVLATLPKAQFPASRQHAHEGRPPIAVGAAASAGKRSSPGKLKEYGGSYAAMAKNSAESVPRQVEIAGASGGGVVDGGSTEQEAAALNKQAARPSSGVGGTSSHHSSVGKSASGGTGARKRAGSTTGKSVGAGSKKAKPTGRSGTRKGSGKTSQPSGATRMPPSEQETPERGTKRPGPSAGAEVAEQAAEEDAQQPPKTKKTSKRRKNAFDVAFEVRLDF